jgi:hypothetical protein
MRGPVKWLVPGPTIGKQDLKSTCRRLILFKQSIANAHLTFVYLGALASFHHPEHTASDAKFTGIITRGKNCVIFVIEASNKTTTADDFSKRSQQAFQRTAGYDIAVSLLSFPCQKHLLVVSVFSHEQRGQICQVALNNTAEDLEFFIRNRWPAVHFFPDSY